MQSLTIDQCLPGATVVVRSIAGSPRVVAKGVAVGGIREKFDLISGLVLSSSDRLVVRQELNGSDSPWTADVLAVPVAAAPVDHGKLAALSFLSRPFQCGQRVLIGGTVPGALVTVAGPAGTIAEGFADEDAARINLASAYPAPGTPITVRQAAPPGWPSPSGTPKVTTKTVLALPVPGRANLPAPLLKGSPPQGCDDVLELASIIDGAALTVVRRSDGTSASAVSGRESFSFGLNPPIRSSGDVLELSQAMPQCERPGDPVEIECPPAAPPDPPVAEAPCPGSTLILLDGLNLGLRVRVQVNSDEYLGIAPRTTPESWLGPGPAKTGMAFGVEAIPPDAVIRVTQERCGLTSSPMTEVTAGNLLVTKRPQVVRPLFACSRVIRVTDATPGAWLRVWMGGPNWKGPISGLVFAAADSLQIRVVPYLQSGHQVWVEQLACGGPWQESDKRDVEDPPAVQPPLIEAPPVAGSFVLHVSAIPGALVEVFDSEGTYLGSGETDPLDNTISLDRPIPDRGFVTAQQTLCNRTSERGPSAPIVPAEIVFTLELPIRWPSPLGGEVFCEKAKVVCRHNSTWTLEANFENTATKADVQLIFGFSLDPNGTPPFGVTDDLDLSAAGSGRVTQIGFRIRGIPPKQAISRSGLFPKFSDPIYWASIVLAAKGKFSMLAAWQTYPESKPKDPK